MPDSPPRRPAPPAPPSGGAASPSSAALPPRPARPGGPAQPAPATASPPAEKQKDNPARIPTFEEIRPGFEPREGDVLVVSHGSVKLPIPNQKFGMVEVCGSIYTRQLRQGDDLVAEYARVYSYLKAVDERAAADKVREAVGWGAEISGGK